MALGFALSIGGVLFGMTQTQLIILCHIAELIPPEKRGHYSDNPAIREAAKGTERYPGLIK